MTAVTQMGEDVGCFVKPETGYMLGIISGMKFPFITRDDEAGLRLMMTIYVAAVPTWTYFVL
jgi:hypothetical protein